MLADLEIFRDSETWLFVVIHEPDVTLVTVEGIKLRVDRAVPFVMQQKVEENSAISIALG